MNTKNFLVSSLAGTVVYFLLGWLFYGVIFKDYFPQPDMLGHSMLFIFLGCLFFAFFMGYIFAKWAGISNFKTGAKAGVIIGLFFALSVNFFMSAGEEPNYKLMLLDVLVTAIMAGLTGAVIAFVNEKMK